MAPPPSADPGDSEEVDAEAEDNAADDSEDEAEDNAGDDAEDDAEDSDEDGGCADSVGGGSGARGVTCLHLCFQTRTRER